MGGLVRGLEPKEAPYTALSVWCLLECSQPLTGSMLREKQSRESRLQLKQLASYIYKAECGAIR